MADDLIGFVQNYQDLSTDKGWQFKFHCDRCQDGYMTPFEASTLGMAGGFLEAAGSIFGGVLGEAGRTAFEVQRAVGGKAHDSALRSAVEKGKAHFQHCARCGKWVCPENCWNPEKGLCKACAPVASEEIAAAQAEILKQQISQKLSEQDLTKGVNLNAPVSARCPKCNAQTAGGKFCLECGAPLAAERACGKCQAKIPAKAKFCPECGTPA